MRIGKKAQLFFFAKAAEQKKAPLVSSAEEVGLPPGKKGQAGFPASHTAKGTLPLNSAHVPLPPGL